MANGRDLCGTCLTTPPPYAGVVTAVTYGYPWDRLIAGFKFHDALDLLPALAELMLTARRRSDFAAPGVLLPVPLSRQRLRERGFNQAWELARRLATRLGCAAEPALLLRNRDTPHQLALPPERRAANVRNAFAVEPARMASLRGQSVTVVDDVMTTGATLAEIATVLREAGACAVHGWVVARTPLPHGPG